MAAPLPAAEVHQVCRDERQAVTVRPGDAQAPAAARTVRRFLALADSTSMLSAVQRDRLAREGVSYAYVAHACTTGDAAAEAAVRTDGDVPGADAPEGAAMTLTACTDHVQLVATYFKRGAGWVVEEMRESQVPSCAASR